MITVLKDIIFATYVQRWVLYLIECECPIPISKAHIAVS